eukprot:2926206-Pyramimonas_sp.AAC.1
MWGRIASMRPAPGSGKFVTETSVRLLPGDTETQDGFDGVSGLLCVGEGPQEHARLAKHEHHDNQERPGLAGFHGEAVG